MQITLEYKLNVMNTNWDPVCECGGQFFLSLALVRFGGSEKKNQSCFQGNTNLHRSSYFLHLVFSDLHLLSLSLSLSHSGQQQGFN